MSVYVPPSLESRENMAADARAAARLWLGPKRQEAGAAFWASQNLYQAASMSIAVAVRRFQSAPEVREYLQRQDIADVLAKSFELWGQLPRQSFGAFDAGPAFAAFLLGRADLLSSLLERTSEVVGTGATARLWAEYHRAIGCLVTRTAYRRSLPSRLQGPQKLWARHLELIQAVTVGEPVDAAVAGTRDEFERENHDRRLMLTTVTTIFPSGADPVRFDLALWAILDAEASRKKDPRPT